MYQASLPAQNRGGVHFGIILEFHFALQVGGQDIALVQPQGFILHAQITGRLVKWVDQALVANGNFDHCFMLFGL